MESAFGNQNSSQCCSRPTSSPALFLSWLLHHDTELLLSEMTAEQDKQLFNFFYSLLSVILSFQLYFLILLFFVRQKMMIMPFSSVRINFRLHRSQEVVHIQFVMLELFWKKFPKKFCHKKESLHRKVFTLGRHEYERMLFRTQWNECLTKYEICIRLIEEVPLKRVWMK